MAKTSYPQRPEKGSLEANRPLESEGNLRVLGEGSGGPANPVYSLRRGLGLEESIFSQRIRKSSLVTSEILGKSIRYCSSQYCFRSERGLLSRAPPRV